jgi:antitoxin MazE
MGIQILAAVVKALGLQRAMRRADMRALEIEKTPGAKELLARLLQFRGRLPKDFKFDRVEANERG